MIAMMRITNNSMVISMCLNNRLNCLALMPANQLIAMTIGNHTLMTNISATKNLFQAVLFEDRYSNVNILTP